ncbi:hypothetical protein ACHAQH_008617 [Verticillium albo-atrum]
MNTWGVINSFGAFQPHYTSVLGRPPSDISWIGSFEIFLLFFIGTFTGRLTDAGFFRALFVTGSALVVAGTFATSFCTQYWQFFLAQGVCMGLGNGCLFCPCLSLLATYFQKKRALAIGISACGSATGGLVFPSIVRELLPRIGFGWTTRVIGFIQLATLVVSFFFLKPRIAPRKAGRLVEWAAFKELEYTFYALGSFLCFMGVYFAFFYLASYSRDIEGLSYINSLNLLLLLNGIGVIGRLLPNYVADTLGTLNMFIPMAGISSLLAFLWMAVSSEPGLYAWTIFYGIAAGGIQSLFPAGLTANVYSGGSGRPPPFSRAAPSIDSLLYNHLVLPSHLPQSSDPEPSMIELALLERLIEVTNALSRLPDNANSDLWDTIRRSLKACIEINEDSRIDRTQLLKHLRCISSSDTLIIHVQSQNAGLLIRRDHDPVFKSCVIFEAFEACPKNEDVLATEAALQWDFPGTAVAIPSNVFQDEDFLVSLSTFLEQASMEATKDFAAFSFKAGAAVYEYRNTGEPAIISSLLMAILEENGRRVAPVLLKKRIRDDVCWNKASKPWRRLPFWLVLRVGIQRHLSLALGGDQGRAEYKFFLCVVFAQFLDGALDRDISVQRVALLRSKLCRRLAKLDVDMERCTDAGSVSRYRYLFCQLGHRFDKSIAKVNADIASIWSREKAGALKQIPMLPKFAQPADLRLELRFSLQPLKAIQKAYRQSVFRALPSSRASKSSDRNRVQAAKAHLSEFQGRIHRLAEMEKTLSITDIREHPMRTMSQAITNYVTEALPLYDHHPEQKSIMLLNVMELWVAIDSLACEEFPLLRDFHPVFYPQMLDLLLLQHFADMKRLQAIQTYLHDRIRSVPDKEIRRTLFDDPAQGCFGERFFTESDEADKFSGLRADIEEAASLLRKKKESEWRSKTVDYNRLTKCIDDITCTYVTECQDNTLAANNIRQGRHAPDCPRCAMKSETQRLRISIYEHSLPSDDIVARVAIFELACPPTFSLYRDTTWLLLSRLASPEQNVAVKPKCVLPDYAQLKTFVVTAPGSLTLASTTKSFLLTHYAGMPFPVDWEGGRDGVCRPNGLKLAYFDQATSSWPGRMRLRPIFAHQVAFRLPKSSPFSKVMDSKHSVEGQGPSSYEILASQATCPPGLNVHEFLAFQTLFSGKARRWLVILTELSSTNLNFSNEATKIMMHHLALQAGPEDKTGNLHRQVHSIFQNENFAEKLLEQMSTRIDSLAANWRETHLMDTIITLLLRTHALTNAADLRVPCEKARLLLTKVRGVCLRWVEMLRAETYRTSDTQAARRCQDYALWAAILCKRTFLLYLEEHGNSCFIMDEESLQAYLECSITIQDNLTPEVSGLPMLLRNAVISEFKLAQRMSHSLRFSIEALPEAFRRAIGAVWPEPDGYSRQLSSFSFTHQGWMSCIAKASEHEVSQTVDYNYVAGNSLNVQNTESR